MSNKRHNDDEFIRSKLDILFADSPDTVVPEVPETLQKRIAELAEKFDGAMPKNKGSKL